jgi:hypothetical protein
VVLLVLSLCPICQESEERGRWRANVHNRGGSIVEVAWIEGKIFNTMKEAEAHGFGAGARVGGSATEETSFLIG